MAIAEPRSTAPDRAMRPMGYPQPHLRLRLMGVGLMAGAILLAVALVAAL